MKGAPFASEEKTSHLIPREALINSAIPKILQSEKDMTASTENYIYMNDFEFISSTLKGTVCDKVGKGGLTIWIGFGKKIKINEKEKLILKVIRKDEKVPLCPIPKIISPSSNSPLLIGTTTYYDEKNVFALTFKKVEVTNTIVKKINFNSKVLSIILNISFTILVFVIIGAFIIKFNAGLDLLYKSFLTIIMMICLKKYICRNYTINGLQNFIGK